MAISIDFEVTNRCNASCHFCPRDRTPHQGLMSDGGVQRRARLERSTTASTSGPPVRPIP